MAVSVRDVIAHAATPWEWRSRAWVVALVSIAIVLPCAFIADAWIGGDGANRLAALLWYGGLGGLMLVRPAVRSLRRWDKQHRSAVAP